MEWTSVRETRDSATNEKKREKVVAKYEAYR